MDVTGIVWRTSSYSGSNRGACVEASATGPAIAVRDSKDQHGPQLAFPTDTWKTFTDQLGGNGLLGRGHGYSVSTETGVGE